MPTVRCDCGTQTEPGCGTVSHTLRTALVDTADGKAATAQRARLNAWLADHPTWHDIALAGMDRWVDLILRFRFDRVPTLSSGSKPDWPGTG